MNTEVCIADRANPGQEPGNASRLRIDRCSVVVVGYQGERWLPDCLDSLARASRRRLQLVLVDNGGNGAIDRLSLAPFDPTIVQTSRTMGFADANNFGLVRGGLEAGAVCFLNQDTVSEPGWLDACLECLERRPDVGAVSPLLTTFDGRGWDSGFAACVTGLPQFGSDPQSGVPQGVYEVPQVTAAAMVIRSDVLLRAGPFDPIFGSYYEDYDLCRRIREAGFRIAVCGDAAVRHFGGSTTTTSAAAHRRTRQILRNRAIMRVREGGRRRTQAFAKVLQSVPRNLARGLFRTPSSQPVGVQLAAYCDLLRLAPRIMSQHRDNGRWHEYLREIGWPAT